MIGDAANVAPEQCAKMQEATLRGDYAEARRINDTLARLHRALFLEASPTLAKYALAKLGLCTEDVRLPIVPSASDVACVQADPNAHVVVNGVLLRRDGIPDVPNRRFSVREGFFLLDANYRIGSVWSDALSRMFSRDDFAGLSFEELADIARGNR